LVLVLSLIHVSYPWLAVAPPSAQGFCLPPRKENGEAAGDAADLSVEKGYSSFVHPSLNPPIQPLVDRDAQVSRRGRR